MLYSTKVDTFQITIEFNFRKILYPHILLKQDEIIMWLTKKPSQISPPSSNVMGRGPWFIVFAALLWSLAGLLIKYIPWNPLAIASGRSLLASLVFLIAYRGRLFHRPNLTTWLSGIAIMLTQTGFVIANKLTTAANAIMLQYASPFFVVLLGSLIYHYRPSKREMTALLVAFGGIILFFLDDLSFGNLIGNALALMTGVTFACVFLFNNRLECNTPVALIIGQLGTFLIGLPSLISNRSWQPVSVLAILILGIFQLGIAYVFFGIGIATTKPLSANLLAMVEPIANPIWVFLLVHEIPGVTAIIGSTIIIAAVIYLNANRVKRIEPFKHDD